MGQSKIKKERKAAKAPVGPRLHMVTLQPHFVHYDERGRAKVPEAGPALGIMEADVPAGVLEFLRSKGLVFTTIPDAPPEVE